jgi:hypothetical protein
MPGILLLLITHSMAAIAIYVYATRERVSPAGKWAAAALLLGIAPFGPFAWITRDDWGVMNKLVGCLVLFGIEVLILSIGVSLVFS